MRLPRDTRSLFLPWEGRLLHALTVLAFLWVALSGVYVVWRLEAPVIVLACAIAIAIGWITKPERFLRESHAPTQRAPQETWGIALAVLLDILILATLFWLRTDQAISSPWQAVPLATFACYGLASLALLSVAARSATRPGKIFLPALMLHAVVTWQVSLIIYALGFGFDPFIHQAAEQHILQHGVIFPKTPFYIGQYVGVVSIARITGLSLAVIDRILVPFTAALLIPTLALIGLRRAWFQPTQNAFAGVWAIFLIPVSYFAFTTPFNLALIPLVTIVLLLPRSDDRRARLFLVSMALYGLAIHPLAGIPAALIVAAVLFRNKWNLGFWLPFAGIPVVLCAAFFGYTLLHHAIVPWPSIWDALGAFFALFGNPYTIALGSPLLAAFYSLIYVFPLFLFGVGLHGLSVLSKKQDAAGEILLAATAGLILAAFFISTVFYIPDIIANEQYEFSLRLLSMLPLLLFPGIAFVVQRACAVLRPRTIVLAALACLSVSAWYVTYPQHNAIAHFSAPGLSQADVDAVRFIDHDAHGGTYAVLSQQMMGAAALQQFGFEREVPTMRGSRYFYSIPTGGELYALYLRLLSEDEDPADAARDIRELIPGKTVYVVFPGAWDADDTVAKRVESVGTAVGIIQGLRIYKINPSGHREMQ